MAITIVNMYRGKVMFSQVSVNLFMGGVVGMFRELAMSREWEPTPQDMGPGIPRNAGGTHFTGMLSCIIFRSLFLAHRYPSQGISRETKRTENSWNIFTIFLTVVSVTM